VSRIWLLKQKQEHETSYKKIEQMRNVQTHTCTLSFSSILLGRCIKFTLLLYISVAEAFSLLLVDSVLGIAMTTPGLWILCLLVTAAFALEQSYSEAGHGVYMEFYPPHIYLWTLYVPVKFQGVVNIG